MRRLVDRCCSDTRRCEVLRRGVWRLHSLLDDGDAAKMVVLQETRIQKETTKKLGKKHKVPS